jgi:hypothetical protein
VIANSSAERAGLAKGDILLQFNGVDINSGETLRNCLANLTDPEQAVEVTVLDGAQSEAPSPASKPKRLQIVPDQIEVTDTEQDRTTLRPSLGIQHYTGLQAAMIPAEQANQLYGANEPVLLVTGVVGGSPAYYAGLRAGDRIQSVNGGPASLDELKVAVINRVRKKVGISAPLHDLTIYDNKYRMDVSLGVRTELQMNDSRDSKDAPLTLDVDGPLGPHSTELPITSDNIDTVARINLPGILTSRTEVRGTGVQFLDPGFTIGFDHRSYAAESKTREPAYDLSFELLPFGMFKVKSFPNTGQDEITLFWFLTL